MNIVTSSALKETVCRIELVTLVDFEDKHRFSIFTEVDTYLHNFWDT